MDKDKLLQEIKNDKRTTGQVFASLKKEIILASNGKIKDEQAVEATRNLIGLFEAIIEIPHEKRSFSVDETKNTR